MEPAEFDRFAAGYSELHRKNIAISGYDTDLFAEYKVEDTAQIASQLLPSVDNLLDFGSGIGNSIPHFRKYFPRTHLTCADLSPRSLEVAQQRFPGNETFAVFDEKRIPLPDASQDLAFCACVFHHIPHHEHALWLSELRRVVRAGGVLVIFEHNPLNPLTVHAVNTCPFDKDAELIGASTMNRRMAAAGWSDPKTCFRLFFPAPLRALRKWERFLCRLPLGAQYRATAVNSGPRI